jgi:hypothetical protein
MIGEQAGVGVPEPECSKFLEGVRSSVPDGASPPR